VGDPEHFCVIISVTRKHEIRSPFQTPKEFCLVVILTFLQSLRVTLSIGKELGTSGPIGNTSCLIFFALQKWFVSQQRGRRLHFTSALGRALSSFTPTRISYPYGKGGEVR